MRDPLFALSSFSVFNLWGLSHTTGMTQVKWPQVVKGLLSNKFGMEWIELCYHLGDSALVQNETTYSFAFLGTDNIPWKPIETVMHHISTDPASISIAWVTLSCKSIDELLREQIDFWGESEEKKKGGHSWRRFDKFGNLSCQNTIWKASVLDKKMQQTGRILTSKMKTITQMTRLNNFFFLVRTAVCVKVA